MDCDSWSLILGVALIFLRRQLVSSRSCSDCGYLVEWSQLMWRPMLVPVASRISLASNERCGHGRTSRVRRNVSFELRKDSWRCLVSTTHGLGILHRRCPDAAHSRMDGPCWWTHLGGCSSRVSRRDDGCRVLAAACLLQGHLPNLVFRLGGTLDGSQGTISEFAVADIFQLVVS